MEKVAEENPCDYLFKMADKFGLARPHFALIHAEGPSHNPVLTMEATFHNLTQRGRGSSKKEAKRWAALAVIAQLDLTTLTAEGSSPCRELRRGKKRKLPEPPIQDQSGQNLTAKHNTDQFQATLGYHVGAESAQTASWTYPLAPFTPSDDLFRQKLRQIQPSQASIEQLMSMVNHVERALLSVAKGWDMEPSNPILGASRVGGLAQGSLITKDQTVSIVVMAQDRPTHPFLELLHQKLDRELSIVSNTNEYSCQVMPEKSGMTIVPINPNHLNHFSLNITVTSLKWRGIPNDSEESGTPDLSARQGLKALAEIRRHRWFETCLRPLPFGIDIVQVLRDLAHRDPVLSVLSDWSLELLTERALYCNMEPLSPFRNLLRVFEVRTLGFIPSVIYFPWNGLSFPFNYGKGLIVL